MPGLTPPALRPLPLATLRPTGWLLERLRLQADGMAGHLDDFWPDVARSGWIGGDAEGWERGPYWLDGITGVAYLRFLRLLDVLLDEWPLQEWARSRWTDIVWVINQLYDLTGSDWLLQLAVKCREQGFDWFAYADDLPFRDKVDEATLLAMKDQYDGNWMNDVYLSSHGVNVAMGLKAMPVWWRHSSTDQQARLLRLVAALDEHHGQASGLFSCDEHLAGRHPSQGTETCTVVEHLASLLSRRVTVLFARLLPFA